MRQLFLAAFGVLAVAGVAAAQQPQVQYIPQPMPSAVPVVSPSAAATASAPVYPVSGTSYIRGSGCTSCGAPAASSCQYGSTCNNGCGSVKSDLAFHFGSCKGFFNACGPTCGNGSGHGLGGGRGLFGGCCPTLPFAQPYGIGWQCPRQYDTYANH
jgi:hypothetical protein